MDEDKTAGKVFVEKPWRTCLRLCTLPKCLATGAKAFRIPGEQVLQILGDFDPWR
jgi:hypothetical protein